MRGGLPVVALACALGGGPAHAAIFESYNFSVASNLSVWTGAPSPGFDTGRRFLGTGWPTIDRTVGGFVDPCPIVNCPTGAELGLRTSGRFGIDYRAAISAGDFDIQLPGRAVFDVPTSTFGTTIGALTIGTRFERLPSLELPAVIGGPLIDRPALLQVDGPSVEAYLDLVARADFFAGARGCVVGVCKTFGLGPLGFDESREIASVNRGGSGEVRVLDTVVSANQTIPILGGLGNIWLNLPDLDSSSVYTPGNVPGGDLVSTRRASIAGLNVNLAQLAANSVGLPIPLQGSVGPIGYNLLQSNAGLALDIEQSLTFRPEVLGRMIFTNPVIPVVGGIDQPAATAIDFRFGDDVTFKPGQVGRVDFQPLIVVNGQVRNQTSLVVSGDVSVQALGADVFGLNLGPLVNERLSSSDLGRLTLYDETFPIFLGGQFGAPISLDFESCRVLAGPPEFPSLWFCASSGYQNLGPVGFPDGTRQEQLNRFSCFPYPPGTLPSCTTIPFAGATSRYFPTPRGRVLVNDPRAFFDILPIVPGASWTDADAIRLLMDLGYMGPPFGPVPDFVIPPGGALVDFVPAPATVLLFGLAAGLLAVGRRRRRTGGSSLMWEWRPDSRKGR
jgi:hypothetical protein